MSVKQVVLMVFRPTCSGGVPAQWRMSMIVPIAISRDVSNAANYRPISLTRILCKVLENHIHQLMYEHLQDLDILSHH